MGSSYSYLETSWETNRAKRSGSRQFETDSELDLELKFVLHF